ncbi:glycoside hydrolase family 43 protein [Actinoplanes sp. CA-030573]|uniref:glycoside hydrolase family 43 protein n=1 Tax=Actinoplanes sp. CA-030573 TaxID=3239898 RepID=UPI003D8A5F49
MTAGRATFRNPVHPGYFADPYVIRADGRWWALGTSGAHAVTGLVSDDLVRWEPWTPALSAGEPHLDGRTHAWAPEMTSRGERFHLYFSAGVEDRHHRIFVADAGTPDGPYVDVRPVEGIDEPFAIDAHVFSDRGRHYLYYAADRTDRARPGTAIVVQELVEPDRVDGLCRPVVMPGADWQIYERGRSMYGAVYDWHTCEGPFVVRRGSRYWCLYSGGSWQTESYGMGSAWADDPRGPWHDVSRDGPTVIRTVSGRARGPGHASVITDLAGDDWLVYHAWDEAMTARRMHLDRLDWIDGTPVCRGPTLDEQPAPVGR